MMDQAQTNYMNIMTFTVIAQALAVSIIASLAFTIVKPFSPLLLTVLIGLLIVIAWSLYTIRSNKSRLEKQFRALNDNIVSNVPCPDYYVRGGDEAGNTICKNEYMTPDNRLSYKFQTNPSTSFANSDIDQINVDQMFKGKRFQDVCLNNLDPGSVFGQIPWTGVKPNCKNMGENDDFESYLRG